MMIFGTDKFKNSALTVQAVGALGQSEVRNQSILYVNVTTRLRLA